MGTGVGLGGVNEKHSQKQGRGGSAEIWSDAEQRRSEGKEEGGRGNMLLMLKMQKKA